MGSPAVGFMRERGERERVVTEGAKKGAKNCPFKGINVILCLMFDQINDKG